MNVMALAGPEIAVGVCVVEVTDVTYSRNLRRGIKRGSKITSDLENFLDRSSWQAFGAGAKLDNVAQSWRGDALQSSDMTGWQ